MADPSTSFSSITPTPPRVTCITHGVFELPTSTGEPIIFTVPAGYMLYIGEVAPTASIGQPGDWYVYSNTGGVYRKINPTIWSIITTWGGGSTGGTGTVTSVNATVPAFLQVTGGPVTVSGVLAIDYSGTPLPVANGGTGDSSPSLVAGTNIAITGTWPNQTISTSGVAAGTVTSVSVTPVNGISGTVATSSSTPAISLLLGDITPSSVTTTGINSEAGSNVYVAYSMPALAINVVKGLNTKSIAADTTFTFSGTPANSNQEFSIRVTNTDSAAHVITIPSTFDSNTQSNVTSFVIQAGGIEEISFIYTGTQYIGYNIPYTPTTISSKVATGSAVSLTTATATSVTSISLTAGDWYVEGNVNINETSATVSASVAGINTSVAIPVDGTEVYSGIQSTTLSFIESITLPAKKISLTSTTTIYLVVKQTFSAGSAAAFGSISASQI